VRNDEHFEEGQREGRETKTRDRAAACEPALLSVLLVVDRDRRVGAVRRRVDVVRLRMSLVSAFCFLMRHIHVKLGN
jgi:hypothetical protein